MNIIKKIREDKRMTQTELASAVGITQGMISAYENGVVPTLPIAIRIAKALEVSLEDLAASSDENAGNGTAA